MQFNEQPNFSEPNSELYGNYGKVCKSSMVCLFSIHIYFICVPFGIHVHLYAPWVARILMVGALA